MYLLFDFTGTFGSNCYSVNEIILYDNNNSKISYSITDVYDKVRNGIPGYWNSNIWDKSNLNDNDTRYGEQYSTLFGYNSTSTDPNVKWARLVIQPANDDVSKVRVYTGGNTGRTLTHIKLYKCTSFDHTTNLVNRSDDNLSFIGEWSTSSGTNSIIHAEFQLSNAYILFADTSNNVYTFDDTGTLVNLNKTTSDLVEDDFRDNGKLVPYATSKSNLQQIDNTVKILVKDFQHENTTCDVEIYSPPQMIKSNRLIYLDDSESIDSITIINNSNGEIKVMVSEDLQTWKYWDGSQWVVSQSGLPIDAFNDGSILRFYKFENNANDETDNHGDGTWYGNEQYDDGYIEQAAKFDGSSYIGIDQPISQALFTITGWFKTNQVAHGSTYWNHPTIIVRSASGGGSKDFGVCVKDGYAHFWHEYCSNYYFKTTSHYVSDNEWHFFVLVKDSSEVKLYIDDNTPDVLSCNTTDAGSNIQWQIGVVIDGNGNLQTSSYFNGLLDHLRIFNRPLTETEIQQLYNEKALQLSDFDNSMNATQTNSLTWTEWQQFFTGGKPTQIGFAFRLTDSATFARGIIDKVIISENLVRYRDVTDNLNIDQTNRKISVEFNEAGEYKINYID